MQASVPRRTPPCDYADARPAPGRPGGPSVPDGVTAAPSVRPPRLRKPPDRTSPDGSPARFRKENLVPGPGPATCSVMTNPRPCTHAPTVPPTARPERPHRLPLRPGVLCGRVHRVARPPTSVGSPDVGCNASDDVAGADDIPCTTVRPAPRTRRRGAAAAVPKT